MHSYNKNFFPYWVTAPLKSPLPLNPNNNNNNNNNNKEKCTTEKKEKKRMVTVTLGTIA